MSVHGNNGYFAVEDSVGTTLRNLSVYLDNIDFNRGQETHDDTTFGKTGRTYRGGLTTGSISISGMYDTTAVTGPDVVLKSLVGRSDTVTFEYGPEGNGTGKVKETGECVLESYNKSTPVGDLVKFTAEFTISGAVTSGTFV